ncbi:hypothetical protein MRB53_021345 [Persea americana]|uniref:Uncharacterized protein n=1 Tax=Persea americana TaxID=3435 RepID=A0ACC2L3U9_PERAE|nr:hypothetical protein MRB53_021345 [Persea americana]
MQVAKSSNNAHLDQWRPRERRAGRVEEEGKGEEERNRARGSPGERSFNILVGYLTTQGILYSCSYEGPRTAESLTEFVNT